MNPVKQIGRYEIPILSVAVIKKRYGFWSKVWPGYDVIMTNGAKLRFTETEKQEYDQACEEHAIVMQVWGMCKSAGLRN